MEMRCYRRILHISYKGHVTNEEVRAKIQQAVGPHGDLLTIVVVVAFSSLVRILGDCSSIHSLPALFAPEVDNSAQ